jgi:hypothetical protein
MGTSKHEWALALPASEGGKTFSSKNSESKAAWCGQKFQVAPPAPLLHTQSINMTYTNLHFDHKKSKWPLCQFPKEFGFILELHVWIRGGVTGQSFVMKRSQSFASHRIH